MSQRDPEDLMPDMEGMQPEPRDRTDVDRFGSDPDARFPGAAEDPRMTTADAGSDAEAIARGQGLGEGGGATIVEDAEVDEEA